MKSFEKAILILVMFLISACSTVAPAPTALPAVTATRTQPPTATDPFTPVHTITMTPTASPEPTQTPTAIEDIVSKLLPKGEALTEWEGIPIMPGAIEGEGDTGMYRFTIDASAEDIGAFYNQALINLGWSYLASGTGKDGNTVMDFYQKGTSVMTLSLLGSHDGLMLVMIVK